MLAVPLHLSDISLATAGKQICWNTDVWVSAIATVTETIIVVCVAWLKTGCVPLDCVLWLAGVVAGAVWFAFDCQDCKC